MQMHKIMQMHNKNALSFDYEPYKWLHTQRLTTYTSASTIDTEKYKLVQQLNPLTIQFD